ncbi:hypothetical protein [Streptomyces sp. FH025]|uniref:hypothetical protein n=1 Tax=Streptomyces sp. FH025 TaxID=2815937 RepID=UPI001A9E3026|nr:hypothetical protein [Streptomyces sp. FH025]MBO1416271.1 hypothetical protein [Streptomyces sp. FH025]
MIARCSGWISCICARTAVASSPQPNSILAPVFGVAALIGVLAVFGLAAFNTDGFSPVAFYIAYSGMGPYGLALGAAAWSYQSRTRRQAA